MDGNLSDTTMAGAEPSPESWVFRYTTGGLCATVDILNEGPSAVM
jgi:hypothetical protein